MEDIDYINFFRENTIQFENYDICNQNCSLCRRWGEVLDYYKYGVKICRECNSKLYELYNLQEVIYQIRKNLSYYIDYDNNLELLDEIINSNKYDIKNSKNKIIEFLHSLKITDDYDLLKIQQIIEKDLNN